jgi:hypothetical protein
MNKKNYNDVTGEVNETDQEISKPTKSFATFLTTLEDGRFNDAISEELRALSERLYLHSINYGGKPKGKITIDIELLQNDGIFDIKSNYKVKNPDKPRQRSIAWTDENHNLLPSNPKQESLFKDVNSRTIKTI